jgi:TolA-binding protein
MALSEPIGAQNQKEMTQALQRDIAALQEDMKKMKASQDERLAVINENLRNTLDVVARINEKMAVIQTNTAQKLDEMSRQVGAPTQALSQKVDSMNDQFLNLSNTIAELNSRIGKIDGKLEDVKKMIQTIPPPQPATAPASQVVTGEQLFDNANRDFQAGNTDAAMQGFSDYLKASGDSPRASEAQFNIAEIYLSQKDFDNAIKGYDAVITNYPDSTRVPNAHFMKGVALAKLERNSAAAKEFRIVIAKYPSSTELTRKSKDYLKTMGLPISQTPAHKKSASAR